MRLRLDKLQTLEKKIQPNCLIHFQCGWNTLTVWLTG